MIYFIDYWDKRGETDKSHYTWSCGEDYKEAYKIYERLKKDYKHVHLKKITRVDYYDEPEDTMVYFIDYWDKKEGTDPIYHTQSCGNDYKEACKIYERLKEDYKHIYLKKRYYTNGINSHDYCDEVYQSYDEPDDYISKEDEITELLFDESSMYYTEDPVNNRTFFDQVEKAINEFIEAHGYIYLNQIYEYLGIPWDPKKENIIFNKPLEFFHKTHLSVSINFKEIPWV